DYEWRRLKSVSLNRDPHEALRISSGHRLGNACYEKSDRTRRRQERAHTEHGARATRTRSWRHRDPAIRGAGALDQASFAQRTPRLPTGAELAGLRQVYAERTRIVLGHDDASNDRAARAGIRVPAPRLGRTSQPSVAATGKDEFDSKAEANGPARKIGRRSGAAARFSDKLLGRVLSHLNLSSS